MLVIASEKENVVSQAATVCLAVMLDTLDHIVMASVA